MGKTIGILTCATIVSALCGISPASSQGGSSAPEAVTVHMKNFAFDPAKTTIHVGETVVFQNDDPVTHNVTDTDDNISSGDVAGGKSWRYTFKQAGEYHYACTYHPGMNGEVRVNEKERSVAIMRL